ncbi:MAG: hypothetical protein NW204_00130 [Xanthomonadaceae bacterium]|nr:hypothetical protein [Xanthomonadaceae bacterium]
MAEKNDSMHELTHEQYLECFSIDATQRASQRPVSDPSCVATSIKTDLSKTFELVLETRKFEIQMYWTRTAYFWTLIGAAFAGYFVIVTSDSESSNKQFLGFTISAIGFVLSSGWGLANKGSKYWHENWENHAQILEDYTIGPIFKTLLERTPPNSKTDILSQFVTGPAKYSVSKINIMFSWFFSTLWLGLAFISIPPFVASAGMDYRYILIGGVAIAFFGLLLYFCRTWDKNQNHIARQRETKIVKST